MMAGCVCVCVSQVLHIFVNMLYKEVDVDFTPLCLDYDNGNTSV